MNRGIMSLSEVAGGHLILKMLKQKSLPWWRAVSLADTHAGPSGEPTSLSPYAMRSQPSSSYREALVGSELCKDNGSLLCPWEL